MSGPRVKTAEGGFVEASRSRDAAADLTRDVDGFGLPLEFDAEGNLIGGTPSETEQAAE